MAHSTLSVFRGNGKGGFLRWPDGSYRNRPSAINPGLIGGVACASCSVATGAGGDAASTDRIAGIDLSNGDDGTVFNFGEDAVTAISGHVYLDRRYFL